MSSKTYTLISAWVGDLVSDAVDGAIELSELEARDGGDLITLDELARLTKLPEVEAFFAANNYGWGPDGPLDENELIYLAEGEVTFGRYPTLTITLEPEATMTETLINLTPHTVNIHTEAGITTLEPAGPAPRCATTVTSAGTVAGIPVTTTVFGQVTGLPEPQPGVYLIVSRLVAERSPNRTDLLVPGPAVRGAGNVTIGCQGLARL